ncbi:BTAD domain-containing putative transcriptional regulator [Actinosynnema sp. NPDC047251]|uniref:Transcriptional regulator n=1 Tax=Saccharothrix espanaensis (strain ATCC 51144 / DSM 44229 / JCM 9112 / NBRC 15066 / NRRL 15764) TaxID=1179773 RepID=K0K6C1_SACES|nr:BTAD domain-containing putative transcriptional regulator [Saccharothrix espanaensis]CCH32454.1 Transcriptional regulator [Saccharothrix espanaensis DSM 44229]
MTAGQALRVALLGPVRAWTGAREVALGSARQRGVFAVLALRPGTTVRRDELIRAVWGDDAPATAEGSVYTYVSVLRKALEPERPRGTPSRLLESVGAGYRLVLDPAASDVAEFESLRRRARDELDGGTPEVALRSLDEALALWRGIPMTGLEGPFVHARRLRLAEARTSARELWAEAALAAGAHPEVIAELGALVTEEPLRERARELLMSALVRAGRGAEALEVFREARQVLRAELDVEPGPGLRAAHERALGVVPASPAPRPEPAPARRAEPVLLGRADEVAAVLDVVGDLAAGRGRALWIEGELGIGKSALLDVALARASAAGHQVAHAVADQLSARLPLQSAVDCLGVDVDSPDPRRSAAAQALRDRRPAAGSVFAAADPTAQAAGRLAALVEQLCADGPLVLALDDLQWADDDSVELWRKLAAGTRRLPLLLIVAARPVPRRPGVVRLRRDVTSGGGAVLDLAPLTDTAVAGIVAGLVGGEPGPGLRRIAGWAGGNPLYAREVADTLVREHAVRFDTGLADVSPDVLDRAPPSLVSAVTDRLDFLSTPTREVLRFAALLGGEFAVGDLAVVLGRPVPVLLPAFTEAIAAGVLRGAGPRVAFRHPLIRQALYDGTSAAVRTALHQQAAQALAAAGAPVEHVAGQLLATSDGLGSWAVPWLVTRAPALVHRAPLVAVELLNRGLRGTDDPVLTAYLGNALFRLGHDAEAEEQTRRALPRLRDPDRIAEARWTLAYVPFRASRPQDALAALDEALADPVLTDAWRARLLSLLALVQRAGVGDLDAAEVSARRAIEAGRRGGDPFAVGQALEVLWQVDVVRRDYVRAVGYLDQALEVVGSDPGLTDLRLVLLDNRVFTLQCLDRLEEATETLRLAFAATGPGTPVTSLHVGTAVHRFWLGDWDDAVARLEGVLVEDPELTGFGLREGGPVLLHGVLALIAAHRDDETRLRAHLAAGSEIPLVTVAYRENCDFLVAATATAAVRDGDHAAAGELLGHLLDTGHAVQTTLRHQWLPELVRIALHLGDRATARGAVEACEDEAGRETSVARAAAAARRCRCLFDGDPDGLLEVAAHYRSVGRTYELAQTLEDAAVLLDRRGRADEGAGTRREAVALYRGIGAAWDVRRISGQPA